MAIIQESEDDLQRSLYNLHTMGREYDVEISMGKTKVMAFQGKDPIRCKISLEGRTVEKVSVFKYLGTQISYEEDSEIEEKLSKFQRICGTIARTLKNRARKETQLKFYKTVAAPALTYGSETWTIKTNQGNRIQAAEMKFLRRVKLFNYHIRNEDIREELSIYSINDKIKDYKRKWSEHLTRMADSRIPKRAYAHRERGRRSVGRPRKRWKDDL